MSVSLVADEVWSLIYLPFLKGIPEDEIKALHTSYTTEEHFNFLIRYVEFSITKIMIEITSPTLPEPLKAQLEVTAKSLVKFILTVCSPLLINALLVQIGPIEARIYVERLIKRMVVCPFVINYKTLSHVLFDDQTVIQGTIVDWITWWETIFKNVNLTSLSIVEWLREQEQAFLTWLNDKNVFDINNKNELVRRTYLSNWISLYEPETQQWIVKHIKHLEGTYSLYLLTSNKKPKFTPKEPIDTLVFYSVGKAAQYIYSLSEYYYYSYHAPFGNPVSFAPVKSVDDEFEKIYIVHRILEACIQDDIALLPDYQRHWIIQSLEIIFTEHFQQSEYNKIKALVLLVLPTFIQYDVTVEQAQANFNLYRLSSPSTLSEDKYTQFDEFWINAIQSFITHHFTSVSSSSDSGFEFVENILPTKKISDTIDQIHQQIFKLHQQVYVREVFLEKSEVFFQQFLKVSASSIQKAKDLTILVDLDKELTQSWNKFYTWIHLPHYFKYESIILWSDELLAKILEKPLAAFTFTLEKELVVPILPTKIDISDVKEIKNTSHKIEIFRFDLLNKQKKCWNQSKMLIICPSLDNLKTDFYQQVSLFKKVMVDKSSPSLQVEPNTTVSLVLYVLPTTFKKWQIPKFHWMFYPLQRGETKVIENRKINIQIEIPWIHYVDIYVHDTSILSRNLKLWVTQTCARCHKACISPDLDNPICRYHFSAPTYLSKYMDFWLPRHFIGLNFYEFWEKLDIRLFEEYDPNHLHMNQFEFQNRTEQWKNDVRDYHALTGSTLLDLQQWMRRKVQTLIEYGIEDKIITNLCFLLNQTSSEVKFFCYYYYWLKNGLKWIRSQLLEFPVRSLNYFYDQDSNNLSPHCPDQIVKYLVNSSFVPEPYQKSLWKLKSQSPESYDLNTLIFPLYSPLQPFTLVQLNYNAGERSDGLDWREDTNYVICPTQYWTCCEEELSDPGCYQGYHDFYDSEPDWVVFFKLNGSELLELDQSFPSDRLVTSSPPLSRVTWTSILTPKTWASLSPKNWPKALLHQIFHWPLSDTTMQFCHRLSKLTQLPLHRISELWKKQVHHLLHPIDFTPSSSSSATLSSSSSSTTSTTGPAKETNDDSEEEEEESEEEVPLSKTKPKPNSLTNQLFDEQKIIESQPTTTTELDDDDDEKEENIEKSEDEQKNSPTVLVPPPVQLIRSTTLTKEDLEKQRLLAAAQQTPPPFPLNPGPSILKPNTRLAENETGPHANGDESSSDEENDDEKIETILSPNSNNNVTIEDGNISDEDDSQELPQDEDETVMSPIQKTQEEIDIENEIEEELKNSKDDDEGPLDPEQMKQFLDEIIDEKIVEIQAKTFIELLKWQPVVESDIISYLKCLQVLKQQIEQKHQSGRSDLTSLQISKQQGCIQKLSEHIIYLSHTPLDFPTRKAEMVNLLTLIQVEWPVVTTWSFSLV